MDKHVGPEQSGMEPVRTLNHHVIGVLARAVLSTIAILKEMERDEGCIVAP